jgi:hypothetical protein
VRERKVRCEVTKGRPETQAPQHAKRLEEKRQTERDVLRLSMLDLTEAGSWSLLPLAARDAWRPLALRPLLVRPVALVSRWWWWWWWKRRQKRREEERIGSEYGIVTHARAHSLFSPFP